MTVPQPQTGIEEISQLPSQPPRRWFRLLLAALLIIGGGTAITWQLLTNNQKQPAAFQPAGVKVKTSKVQTGIITDSAEYIATLESRRSINLQPRVQGQISQIYVKSGDPVAAGAEILEIDSRQQQATVRSLTAAAQVTKAQLENVRATLESLEAEKTGKIADVELNQQEYKRYSELAAQGAVSRQTRDLYANRLATAKSELNAINSRIQAQKATILQTGRSLEQADANIKQQQVQLQYYKITAPFNGVVGDIPVKIGDVVNSATQLATITQNRPLEVNIPVPLERGSLLRQGLSVELINSQGKTLTNSRVFFISPNINSNSQSILVKALYNNTEGLLRADQQIRARIIWSQRQGVLVPTSAVSKIAGESFVFLTETQTSPDGKTQLVAQQRRVQLGDITDNNYQIKEGLKGDETIVVSGIQNLRDGVPIITEN
ncbi:MAG: efflux RND transporter periplasmic adaptor subunit [Sphaerospermopsis sp. SIO1G2]|nr:efflux RND transporter periplasmic adaptor subunit [Sphaerospermopsis sp. SIO1G2]